MLSKKKIDVPPLRDVYPAELVGYTHFVKPVVVRANQKLGHNTMGRYIPLLFLFSVISCTHVTSPSTDENELVRETVFRFFMREADRDTYSKYYFLAISVVDSNNHFVSHSDPSKELILKFVDVPIPVKPFSEMIFASGGAVRHRDTNEPGSLFRTGQIQFTSSHSSKLVGGFMCGGRCADTYLFYVSKRDGFWAVDSTSWLWSW